MGWGVNEKYNITQVIEHQLNVNVKKKKKKKRKFNNTKKSNPQNGKIKSHTRSSNKKYD